MKCAAQEAIPKIFNCAAQETTPEHFKCTAQVITGLGTSEDELDADLQERLAEAEQQQYTDDALNAVLLLAAQAEIVQLRASATSTSAPDHEVTSHESHVHGAQ